MENKQTIKDVQNKILEIMKYIDKLCRKNDITYYIMGGTALGAIRHGGFIPWDDDLDIFMTPSEYEKFKKIFEINKPKEFIIQEWKTTPDYLEYAKVRANNTTFIEECFKDKKDMHHGIYVDIMILHKVPNKKLTQRKIYFYSKYVTLFGLSKRNWKPKTKFQKLALKVMKIMPNNFLIKQFYKSIYKYDNMTNNFSYCYWITPAKFKNGLFDKSFFSTPIDLAFEDTKLLGSEKIKDYLEYRYGDYMKLPSIEQQKNAIHAIIYDVEKDYLTYMEN